MFIADFKDGSSFSEKQGYWDDCPNKGITALHLALPFTVRKKDTGEILEASKVTISGYEKYYFANENRVLLPIGGMQSTSNLPGGQGEFVRQVMCGIDLINNFVCWVEVDKRGNVKFRRFTAARFMEEVRPHPNALREGA